MLVGGNWEVGFLSDGGGVAGGWAPCRTWWFEDTWREVEGLLEVGGDGASGLRHVGKRRRDSIGR